jgi:MFS transporter, FHS family, Na+ dependent glucose transporter 1
MNQKYSITAAYYSAFILLGLTIGAEGATLLQLAENTSSTLDRISLIFFFGSLGYLIGSYTSGKIYDRLPGHVIMAWVIFLLGLAAALVPVSMTIWMLLVVILVLGIAKGALDVGCNTLLLWLHREKAGPFVNGLHAAFGLGAFFAPLVVQGIVSTTGSFQWVYWSFAIAAIPVGIWVYRQPSPTARSIPEEHRDIPLPILPLAIMVLCFACYVAAESGFGNFIKTYAILLGLGTESEANYLNSAFWGSFTLGRVLGVWISTRLRSLSLLYLDLAGCCASLVLILAFPGSATILWIGTILLGIFLASIFPALLALSDERMHLTGTMAGWFLVGGSIGGMLAPWVIGQAFVRIGAEAMNAIILASVIATLVSLIFFTRTPVRAGIPQ